MLRDIQYERGQQHGGGDVQRLDMERAEGWAGRHIVYGKRLYERPDDF
jgi:hypothetical protein